MVGNAIDPLVVKGPQIGDISQQTSQEGVPRPIVFALSQPMAGNIVACGDPVIKKKKERQGKGGGPVTETEEVFRTYAIGVCEGPITSWIRVWRNGSLVFDARPGHISGGMNGKFLQNARFFNGSFSQNQSPDLQAKFGVAATPFMRGTAYMVMANENLTDLRGAVPQYAFQVLRCEGEILTSRPYPIDDLDQMASSANPIGGRALNQPFLFDYATSSAQLRSGTVHQVVRDYVIPPDYTISGAELISGDIFHGATSYVMPPEDFFTGEAEMISGEIFADVQQYNIPAESITSEADFLSGTIE
jgi:hypothetical protein